MRISMFSHFRFLIIYSESRKTNPALFDMLKTLSSKSKIVRPRNSTQQNKNGYDIKERKVQKAAHLNDAAPHNEKTYKSCQYKNSNNHYSSVGVSINLDSIPRFDESAWDSHDSPRQQRSTTKVSTELYWPGYKDFSLIDTTGGWFRNQSLFETNQDLLTIDKDRDRQHIISQNTLSDENRIIGNLTEN